MDRSKDNSQFLCLVIKDNFTFVLKKDGVYVNGKKEEEEEKVPFTPEPFLNVGIAKEFLPGVLVSKTLTNDSNPAKSLFIVLKEKNIKELIFF